MSRKSMVVAVCLVLAVSAGVAQAGRVWVHTPVQLNGAANPVTGFKSSLAMRSGDTWPVVSWGNDTETHMAAMTPVGWLEGPAMPNSGQMDAVTAPDGRVGIAYKNGLYANLDGGGWGLSNYVPSDPAMTDKPSLAFNSDSDAAVLYTNVNLKMARAFGSSWYQEDLGIAAEVAALAFDSHDQTNVAYYDSDYVRFALKGNLTNNQWQFTEVVNAPGTTKIDLAMLGNDQPVITYSVGTLLYYATYDILNNQWNSSYLDSVKGPGYTMKADGLGGVGIAYVNSADLVTYAYYDGSSSWDISSGIASTATGGLGLAFDAEDLPVISYYNSSDNNYLYLAYDPIVVPEPVSLTLLLMGGIAVARRRKGS